ncbi:MAG: BON domain-containing protein [Burkholderiales bacterium]
MQLIRALILVSIVAPLAGCDSDQEPARAVEQAVVREILATDVDPDQQLAQKVEKALGIDSGVLPYGVEVTATEGKVELWGTVDSNAARKRFELIAAGVVGVKSIENHLQVDPGA